MNLLQLKEKIKKGIDLGAKVVYIKEDSLLFGIEAILFNEEDNNIVFIKSKEEGIKSEDFIDIIDERYNQVGNIDAYVGKESKYRSEDRPIAYVEFAQYEEIKMLFLNA